MQQTNHTKQCPYCAETILAAAIKCKHCGSMLGDKLPGNVATLVQPTPQPLAPSSLPPTISSSQSFSAKTNEPLNHSLEHSPLKIGAIIRDVLIVWGLTALGGVIARFASSEPAVSPIALAVSNLLLGTVAFAIVGCLAGRNRWRHLSLVALLSWLTSIINMLFGVTFQYWLFGCIAMAGIMGLGGGISFLLRPDSSTTSTTTPSLQPNSIKDAVPEETKQRWFARCWFLCGMLVVGVIYWLGSCVCIEKNWKGLANVSFGEGLEAFIWSTVLPIIPASLLWLPVLMILEMRKTKRGNSAFIFIVVVALLLVLFELCGISSVLSRIGFAKPGCSPWTSLQ